MTREITIREGGAMGYLSIITTVPPTLFCDVLSRNQSCKVKLNSMFLEKEKLCPNGLQMVQAVTGYRYNEISLCVTVPYNIKLNYTIMKTWCLNLTQFVNTMFDFIKS